MTGQAIPRPTRVRPWQAAILVAALAGPALSQTDTTLGAEVASAGQVQRRLASNLRGDVVLLLRDEIQGGKRLAILGWVLRTPGAMLGLTDGSRQLDQQSVDCANANRTLWRSEAYRAQDGDTSPSRVRPIPQEQRRPENFADLSASMPLMGAALRTLCTGGGTIERAPTATPAPASGPATQPTSQPTSQPTTQPTTLPTAQPATQPTAQPALPGPQGVPRTSPINPDENGSSAPRDRGGPSQDPAQPSTPPAPSPQAPAVPIPTRPSIVDRPVFENTVFTVRSLARLSDSTYASTARRDAEAAALRVLAGVVQDLNQRSDDAQQPQQKERHAFKLAVVRMALAESRRKLTQLQRQIDDRLALLEELQLVQQDLPAVPRKAPDSFKAELYRHPPSGQYLLAFRGTNETADWISNAWLGLDLGKMISPHYQAADDLVATLKQRGINPITLGHSLGGGMAQYTAYRHNLRVVGFNPSPVPEHYLTGRTYARENARLFTALELPRQASNSGGENDHRIGDPLSLQLSNLRKMSPTLHNWIKASHHLVQPVCLLTLPEPYFEPDEDADLADAVVMNFLKGPLQTLIHLTPSSAAKKTAMAVATSRGIDFLLQDPAWSKVAGADEMAGIAAQQRAVKAGVTQAKALAAMGKALGTLFNVVRGVNMGRTAVDVTAGVIDMYTTAYIKRMLQVHGMTRFVRGLGASGDLSPYAVQPDGTSPCAFIESTM